MAVSIEITQVAANTATGDQDITITGFGTPKAAMFMLTKATTVSVGSVNHAMASVGWTDGSSQAACGMYCGHSLSTNADNSRVTVTDEVIIALTSSAAVEGEANFKEWITDGVRITWGAALGTAYMINVVLFGGSDLDVDVGYYTSPGTGTTNIDMGITPDALYMMTTGSDADVAANNRGQLMLGVAVNDGDESQRGVSMATDPNGSTTNGQTFTHEDKIIRYCTDVTEDSGLHAVSAFINTPVNGVTMAQTGATAVIDIAYLALKFNDTTIARVGTWTAPPYWAATGEYSHYTPGIDPDFMQFMWAANTALDTDAQGGALGVGCTDGTTHHTWGVFYTDARDLSATTTVSGSIVDDEVARFRDSGNTALNIDPVSLDASGITGDFTSLASATLDTLIPYIAIGQPATAVEVAFAVDSTTSPDTDGLGVKYLLESTGFGRPTAAIIMLSHGITTDTTETGQGLVVAYYTNGNKADGLHNNRSAAGWTNEHGQATTDSSRWGVNAGPIEMDSAVSGATGTGPAFELARWTSNGIELAKTQFKANCAVTITAILIRCPMAATQSFNANSNDTDFTLGWQPDAVFTVGSGSTHTGSWSSWSYPIFGAWATADDDQACYSSRWTDGAGTADGVDRLFTNAIFAEMFYNSSAINGRAVASLITDGFNLDNSATVSPDDGGIDDIAWLALDLGGLSVSLDVIDTPTSTGEVGYTGPGFKPQAQFIIPTNATAIDTGRSDALSSFGFGVFTAAEVLSVSCSVADGVGTTNTATLHSVTSFKHLDSTANTDYVADLTSFDASGATWDWTTANESPARKWIVVSVQSGASDGIQHMARHTALTNRRSNLLRNRRL